MFTLKNIKKISMSSLATLLMILTPTQAIFADEVLTNTTVQSQETQLLGNVTLQGTEWAAVGQETKPIYMNGEIKIVFNGSFGQSCYAYAADQYNNKISLGRIDYDGYLKVKLYGYYKIGLDFITPSSGSSFYVIY